MWALIKYVIAQVALVRWIFGSLGSLGVLIPILMVLKAIGWPVLVILMVVAIPALIILLVIGLPIFMVLLCGAVLVGIAWAFLTVGAVIIKPLIFIVLPMMLVGYFLWWLFMGRRRGGGEKPA